MGRNAALDPGLVQMCDYVSNLAHALRTPLGSILMLSELLAENADGNLTAAQVQFAEAIATSGATLLTLIEDMTPLARVLALRLQSVAPDSEGDRG